MSSTALWFFRLCSFCSPGVNGLQVPGNCNFLWPSLLRVELEFCPSRIFCSFTSPAVDLIHELLVGSIFRGDFLVSDEGFAFSFVQSLSFYQKFYLRCGRMWIRVTYYWIRVTYLLLVIASFSVPCPAPVDGYSFELDTIYAQIGRILLERFP